MVVWCKDENDLIFKFKRDLLIDKISDRIVKTNKKKKHDNPKRGLYVFWDHCPLARSSKINLFIVCKAIVLLRIIKLPYFKNKMILYL